jgi:hypothetical protein
MRKITTISSVLVLTLIFLSSGTLEYGLANSHVIQSEGIQETELLNSREEVYSIARFNKKNESSSSYLKKTDTFAFSNLPNKVTSAIFSFKNPIFIRYCSFLI